MLYTFAQTIIYIILKVIYRLEVIGEENIPSSGGAIVAANHASNLDPPAVGVAIKRRIHFMAKVELFKYPVIGGLLKRVGAFPVRRDSADRNAIRHAIGLLKSGDLLGIFPEGRRNKLGQLGTPQLGTAMIAARSGAPVIPVAVMGTGYQKNQRGCRRIQVIIGKPIMFSPESSNKDELRQFSEKIMEEIGCLLEKNLKN